MQISMYTGYVHNTGFASFEAGLRFMYERGVRLADIVDAELPERPLVMYMQQLSEAQIKPHSLVATPDIAGCEREQRRRNIAAIQGYIDQMEKYGIPYLMPAPAAAPARNREQYFVMRENLIESLRQITEYAKGSGVSVCIENQSETRRADSCTEDIRYILDAVPDLGFVLDAGNFYCVGEDVLASYEALKDRLVYCHFKDWRTDPYGKFVRENLPRFDGCAIGEGVLPLKELSQRLTAEFPVSSVTLEINASVINPEVLAKSASFLRENIL